MKIKGFLSSITDCSVIVADGISKHHTPYFDTIPFTKIKRISFTRRGSGGIGFAIGVSTALGIGLINSSKEQGEDKFIAQLGDIIGGVLLAIPLGAFGAVIGSNTGKIFYINSDRNEFQAMKSSLLMKGYIK